MARLTPRALLFASAAWLAVAPPPAAAREIGAIAAVNRDVDGTPPDAPTRSLLIGDRLIENERLVSSPDGSGQLLFIDQTSLTISANSDIVLDKYIYDPDRKTGEIGISVAKGVLRLIGGRITKEGEAVIRTPSATIGIRGGIALISVQDGVSQVMHIAGEYTRIDAGGETLTLSRANAFASVPDRGGSPEYQGVASEEVVAGLFNTMQGGGGGRPAPVTREAAQAEGGQVARVNSQERTVVTRPPISTRGERPASDRSSETEQRRLGSGRELQDNRQEEVQRRAEERRVALTPDPRPEPRPRPPLEPVVDGEPLAPPPPNPLVDPDLPPPDPLADLPPPNPLTDLPPVIDPLTDLPLVFDPPFDEEPDLPTSPNPFAGFFGGAVFTNDGAPVVDDFGQFIPLPASQNFTSAGDGGDFALILEGSVIGVFPNGDEVSLPVGEGVFPLNPSDTASPVGALAGFGFGDGAQGFHLYQFQGGGGEVGAAIFAEPGASQLTSFNNLSSDFQVLPFRILGDGALVDPGAPGVPFLSPNATSVFAGIGEHRLFLVSDPNAPITDLRGVGAASFAGTRALLPVFSLNGQNNSQSYALFVGTAEVLDNGVGAPTFPMITSGSFITAGEQVANRLQQTVGPISIGAEFGPGFTVFGRDDTHLVLSNDAPYLIDDLSPEPSSVASFEEDPSFEEGEFNTYGNLHGAVREPSLIAPVGTRIEVGASPADFALDTGFSIAAAIPPQEARLLSGVYSSGIGFLNNTSEKIAFRTTGESLGLGFFNLQDARGGISLVMDESDASASITATAFHFGGDRSVVISDTTFGMQENRNPAAFATEIGAGAPFDQNSVLDSSLNTVIGAPPDIHGATAFTGALLSHGVADVADLYPAGTDITPEFLTWGWWTGQFRFDAFDPSPLETGTLQFSLGTWVGGDVTGVLPTTGSATFNGPVTLNYTDDSQVDFVDGGRFTMTYDFGANAGTATFTDLIDLPQIDVPVGTPGASTGAHYDGVATVAGADVAVSGSFFDGPTQNDARATAGGIRINRPVAGARGVGTFWGER